MIVLKCTSQNSNDIFLSFFLVFLSSRWLHERLWQTAPPDGAKLESPVDRGMFCCWYLGPARVTERDSAPEIGRELDNPLSGLVEYQRRMDLKSFPPRINPSNAVARHPTPAHLPECARQGWMAPTRQGLVNQVNEVLTSAKFQGR